MKEISSLTVLVTILTFANYSRAGRNRWEWAFLDCAFGAGTLVQGAQGSQEAPLARLLLQSETSFPYWSPASLRPLSHRSARTVSSPLIGWDATSLTEPTNQGPGHRLGDFIISHLGSYPGEKSRFGAEVWSDIYLLSALKATAGLPKGCCLSHGLLAAMGGVQQCTAPALQWRPAGGLTVSLGGLPVEGTPLRVRTGWPSARKGLVDGVRGPGRPC